MAQDNDVNSKYPQKLNRIDVKEISNVNTMEEIETGKEKLFRKVRENPFVPLGCAATVCALCYGLYNVYHRRSLMSQYMMRARVAAQAFTFIAILTGIALQTKKKNT